MASYEISPMTKALICAVNAKPMLVGEVRSAALKLGVRSVERGTAEWGSLDAWHAASCALSQGKKLRPCPAKSIK